MKLQTKLALFATFSSLIIALLMILLLPVFVRIIADRNTNAALVFQKSKVLKEIETNGLDYYLEGDSSYGSYSMLKDEYISIEPGGDASSTDIIKTEQRIIDQDTINYRILTRHISLSGKNYLLEIGHKASSISQDSRQLQKMALYVLIGLVLLILIANIVYTRHLLKPLNYIINTKLINNKLPFKNHFLPIKTSTFDFKYLDKVISGLMEQINLALKKEREFSSNASHELMTPISIIQSKLENLIADESMHDEHVRKIEEMMRTLNRLKKVANSLLLISRIDNEQYVRNDHVKIHELIEEVIEELSHRFEQKQLQLKSNINKSVILNKVNRGLLFQLFFNLLNNAIQYNKLNGSIEITDRLIPDNQYSVVIKDTGIGINENQLPFIFDRFKKAPNAGGESNGLGLSIVSSISKYHNTHVNLSSSDSGTTVEIVFYKEHI